MLKKGTKSRAKRLRPALVHLLYVYIIIADILCNRRSKVDYSHYVNNDYFKITQQILSINCRISAEDLILCKPICINDQRLGLVLWLQVGQRHVLN